MKTYIVVEGAADAVLLERLLRGKLRNGPQILAAGGKSSVTSFAQSLMVGRHAPVAVVVDADTVDESLVCEQKQIFVDRLAAYSHGVPFRVFLAIPEIEHLFFETPDLLQAELDAHISKQDAHEAMLRPKNVLDRVLKGSSIPSREEFFAKLSDDAVEKLAQLPFAASLIAFLRRPRKLGMKNGRWVDNVA